DHLRAVAIEGQGCVPVVVREEARVNGDVHGGHASCGSVTGASRFLIGLVTCFATRTLQKNAGVGPGTGDERVVSATGETLGELWRNLAETFPELMWRLSPEAGEPSRWEAETHAEPLGRSSEWASAPARIRRCSWAPWPARDARRRSPDPAVRRRSPRSAFRTPAPLRSRPSDRRRRPPGAGCPSGRNPAG